MKGLGSKPEENKSKREEAVRCVVSTSCPLDCWDACSILATVEDGEVRSLKGNPANPVTGKGLCTKGLAHMARRNHPERLRTPLVRASDGVGFREATWEEALDLVAEKMEAIRHEGPTTAVLHCTHAGSVGLLKKLESGFFSAYGGVQAGGCGTIGRKAFLSFDTSSSGVAAFTAFSGSAGRGGAAGGLSWTGGG